MKPRLGSGRIPQQIGVDATPVVLVRARLIRVPAANRTATVTGSRVTRVSGDDS